MSPTAPFSWLLMLWVAGLAQGKRGSFRSQDSGPQPLELKEVFRLFQIQYNRTYSDPAEYARRLDIFAHNLAQAQRLQEQHEGAAQFGVTPFSDLTEEEFGQLHQRAAGGAPNMSRKVWSQERGQSTPASCDWRKKLGVLSPIRNQGNCKCCWAVAAAGNIEALWAIKYDSKSVEVSVQELVDCGRCGNGCTGGWVWEAFITTLNNSGLVSEENYPFKGNYKPQRCQAKRSKEKVAWIQDFIMLPEDENAIARHVATQGPITVTINMQLLQHYKSGVIKATDTNCDPRYVDHSVLLVGFGKKQVAASSPRRPTRATPYWILKNSWGADWGEQGYFRLQRGKNSCGITKYPITARVDKPVKPVSCPP
ncbi:Cathepsin W [Galemys pyrenaicus]|uniref:Cathepsin W n=1 Tax=Galemys pyrenaicus TaxID=202257 RepID=A0A8J6AJQ1_GALPY|nr:Cathepsin W [Galemys pyrenaicus]